jgi:acyl dehydratase
MNATTSLPTLRMTVTERDTKAWAEILDDDNPLHSDPEALAARGVGRGIVSPGPANIGYLMTLLLNCFPGSEIEAFEARFVGLVLAPSEVEARGRIEREESTPTGRVLHCSLELHAVGGVAVVATARLRLAGGSDPDSV